MRDHMFYHVQVDGINGSTELCRLLTCAKVLGGVKVPTFDYAHS